MAHVPTAVSGMSDALEKETEMNSGGQNGIDNRNGTGSSAVIGPSSFVFGENMESRVLKRPAEEQLDRKTTEQDDDENTDKKEDPGEFPKASSSVMSQRPIMFASAGSGKEGKTEKEESKSSFKLNPPTLVHGKAKSAPKTTDAEGEVTTPAKPLLRPSPLCHASPHWATLAADGKQRNPEDGSVEVSSSSTPRDPTDTTPKGEGSSSEASSTNGKPKVNYFIKLSSNESNRDTGFGVFGNFSTTNVGFGKNQDHNGTTNDNYFLQFAKVDSSCKDESGDSPKGLSNSGNSFVFGQNMDERVASVQAKDKEQSPGFPSKFGAELSPTLPLKGEASDTSPGKQETACKSLLESASAYEKAKKSSEVTFEVVNSKTGEEDEENVFQAQCKLFVFDTEKHTWQERGRGLLRLNDQVPATEQTEPTPLQSRLVMRTQGSLRVVLNTKIWSGMTIEKATPKNIRLSAKDGESDGIRVFLVSASPKDAEQIYRAIEYRVQELKYAEQQQAERAKEEAGHETPAAEEEGSIDKAVEDGASKNPTMESTKTSVQVTLSGVDSDDSVSQSNSALTDRSSPETLDPRIVVSPETPPASN